MLRRRAVSLLLGAAVGIEAERTASLERFLDPRRGSALLLDIRSHKLIATNSADVAGHTLLPPGSTLKPFVLAALLRRGSLRADTSFVCPAKLAIGKRSFDCSHPRLVTPMRADTALAYSCNCFVAHAAEQFRPTELAGELKRLGFAARTGLTDSREISGRIDNAGTPDQVRMQALGEEGILTTPLALASAYRQLALKLDLPEMQPILQGLEGAVDFGTAQRARVAGVRVAAKTGSTLSPAGDFIAWFAGFMPSRAPEVVVTVMLPGHSGGSDAAPIAGEILEAYRAKRL
jgi:cell division protein FtsI/penicillin-binding protein 2